MFKRSNAPFLPDVPGTGDAARDVRGAGCPRTGLSPKEEATNSLDDLESERTGSAAAGCA